MTRQTFRNIAYRIEAVPQDRMVLLLNVLMTGGWLALLVLDVQMETVRILFPGSVSAPLSRFWSDCLQSSALGTLSLIGATLSGMMIFLTVGIYKPSRAWWSALAICLVGFICMGIALPLLWR